MIVKMRLLDPVTDDAAEGRALPGCRSVAVTATPWRWRSDQCGGSAPARISEMVGYNREIGVLVHPQPKVLILEVVGSSVTRPRELGRASWRDSVRFWHCGSRSTG